MIQRIQSLFLLATVLLSACLFFVPLYSAEWPVGDTPGSPSTGVSSNTVYILLNSLAGIFAAVCIFLFRNRKLQIRLCNLNMLIICIFIGTIFYFADASKGSPAAIVHYAYGSYFPLIQLLFSFLAMRSIKKDEELVKSADRLR